MDIVGKTISHYRILERLGRGGMGEVYKAEDVDLKRVVALKFLSPELTLDEDAKTRFMHEAQAASALQHQNICTIHEVGQTADGRLFICMDYYPGGSLAERTGRGPLPVREAAEIAAQAADGLARAHAASVVHRDVKPANVAVTGEGVVKILDFGLAMLADRTRVTKAGTTLGTVPYMSPEQAQGGEVTPASDVWSLGVILYEMLTGRLPFSAEQDVAVLYKILHEEYEPIASVRDGVPQELAQVVDRALAKDPLERFRDGGEMATALREVLSEMTPVSLAASNTTGRRGRGSRLWLGAVVVVVVAAALFVVKPMLFDGDVVSAPRPIAVISFENRTGDTQYDYLREAIPNLLITSLEQSKYLSVITWERMHDLLEQAGRRDVASIDRDAGFEVCRMEGVDAIVLGSFAKAGDVFATDVKVLDVRSKELLKSASAKGNGVGSILDHQIDELGKEISSGIGLSERSIESAGARPIAAVTTSSMDAYDYFVRGKDAWDRFNRAEALGDLQRAVGIDSSFAVAWLYLARTYDHLRDARARDAAFERAQLLAASAPEKDRLYIDAFHASIIEHDDAEYRRFLLELTSRYPREKEAFCLLGTDYKNTGARDESERAYLRAIELDPSYGEALNGIAYLYASLEDYGRAIDYFERYASVQPEDANPIDSMAEMYFRLGRLDDAVATYRRAIEVNPQFGSQRPLSYVLALQEDYDGFDREMEQYLAMAPSSGLKAGGYLIVAFCRLNCCRWQDALEALAESRRVFDRLDHRYGSAGVWWMEGWVRYLMGDYEESHRCLDEAERILVSIDRTDPGPMFMGEVLQGLVDLREGHLPEARARIEGIAQWARRMEEGGGEDRIERAQYVLGLYRAELLLAADSVDASIEVWRGLQTPQVPAMNPMNMFAYNFPTERDVLARALVRRGSLDEAIAEYERLTTFDPTSKDRRLVYALFHYRLARLYEETGRSAPAIDQYGRFLKIVGGDDSVIPEAVDARTRQLALTSASP